MTTRPDKVPMYAHRDYRWTWTDEEGVVRYAYAPGWDSPPFPGPPERKPSLADRLTYWAGNENIGPNPSRDLREAVARIAELEASLEDCRDGQEAWQ